MSKKSPTRLAVERGAKALTLFYGGEKWMDRIRQDDLDLGNPSWCIVGQLNGRDYGKGINTLGVGVRTAPDYFGFELPADEPVETRSSSYARLTRVWKNYFAARKSASASR